MDKIRLYFIIFFSFFLIVTDRYSIDIVEQRIFKIIFLKNSGRGSCILQFWKGLLNGFNNLINSSHKTLQKTTLKYIPSIFKSSCVSLNKFKKNKKIHDGIKCWKRTFDESILLPNPRQDDSFQDEENDFPEREEGPCPRFSSKREHNRSKNFLPLLLEL